jgi:hypothetical protein
MEEGAAGERWWLAARGAVRRTQVKGHVVEQKRMESIGLALAPEGGWHSPNLARTEVGSAPSEGFETLPPRISRLSRDTGRGMPWGSVDHKVAL